MSQPDLTAITPPPAALPPQARAPYAGPAVLSYGFRPLFLLAGLFATLVVPLWMLVWSGDVTLSGPFSPLDWHIHEMLFGYTSAVIAGMKPQSTAITA